MLFRASSKFLSYSHALLALPLFVSVALAQPEHNFQNLLFEPSVLNEQTPLAESDELPATALVDEPTNPHITDTAISIDEFFASQKQAPVDQLETINSDIANYKKVILDLEQKGGAYEAGLSEELLALASLYQKNDEYAEAQKVLNRAAHIARVNNGLFDAAQVPLLKKVIENYVELGDIVGADRQQEALFYMQQRLYSDSDIELLPALKYYAEWNIFAATTNITPAATESESSEDEIVDTVSFQFQRLVNAKNLYDAMMQILIMNPGFDDSHLAQVENQLLVISHIFATRYTPYASSLDIPSFSGFSSLPSSGGGFMGNVELGYRNGIDILENRINRILEQPTPDPRKLAAAKVELAEWLLVFDRRMTAVELLEETYNDMTTAAVPEEKLSRLLHPALPQEIPEFRSHRYTRPYLGIPDDVMLQYKGYVDVEFEVNRFGGPSSIMVLGTSPDTDEEIVDRLVNHIRYSQIRPRVQNGKVPNADLYRLRYHYTY